MNMQMLLSSYVFAVLHILSQKTSRSVIIVTLLLYMFYHRNHTDYVIIVTLLFSTLYHINHTDYVIIVTLLFSTFYHKICTNYVVIVTLLFYMLYHRSHTDYAVIMTLLFSKLYHRNHTDYVVIVTQLCPSIITEITFFYYCDTIALLALSQKSHKLCYYCCTTVLKLYCRNHKCCYCDTILLCFITEIPQIKLLL